jgi:hypothetical protein
LIRSNSKEEQNGRQLCKRKEARNRIVAGLGVTHKEEIDLDAKQLYIGKSLLRSLKTARTYVQ